MKKYLPLILVSAFLGIAGYIVFEKKQYQASGKSEETFDIGTFKKVRSCVRSPKFLKQLKIPQPVIIDLSQKQYKGIALYFDKNFKRVLHFKQWEQFEHFSTYTLDKVGNIYLIPTPFISIKPTTFNLQKNIYKINTQTGKLSIWMHFDDVHPNANNPYGLNAIAYDCDDSTLWASSIDESNYENQKGTLYHIDTHTKEILQKVKGFDVLSMTLVKSQKGKFLLLGSARDNALYAYAIHEGKLSSQAKKIFELPSANEHIRKIIIKNKNTLELQSISFSYSLIAQSADKDRNIYEIYFDDKKKMWTLKNEKK